MKKYDDIDGYLANFSGKARQKLDTIRKLIKEEVPEAGEKISYGIPTATLDGKYFVYFAGFPGHVSIYPVPIGVSKALQKEIDQYRAGKGTLHFALDKPLPTSFIRKIIIANRDRREQMYKK